MEKILEDLLRSDFKNIYPAVSKGKSVMSFVYDFPVSLQYLLLYALITKFC